MQASRSIKSVFCFCSLCTVMGPMVQASDRPVTEGEFNFQMSIGAPTPANGLLNNSNNPWWKKILGSVILPEQVQEILKAEEAEGKKPSLREHKDNLDSTHGAPPEDEIEKAKEIRFVYENFREKATQGQWRIFETVSNCILELFREKKNEIKNMQLPDDERFNQILHPATEDSPAVTYRQDFERRRQQFWDEKCLLSRDLFFKVLNLIQREESFLTKLRTLERDITLSYPQTPTIFINPISGWQDTLRAKATEEISKILALCFEPLEVIPQEIATFLERCGYRNGDKVLIFSPRKAFKVLPLTENQKQKYESLTKNKEAFKQFIDDFWHDKNRIQFKPSVLKDPDKTSTVQASLDAIVQYLQNLSDQPYWRNYIVFLHAMLEAPATRFRKLNHLVACCQQGFYDPTRNEVIFDLGEASAQVMCNIKSVSIHQSEVSLPTTQGDVSTNPSLQGMHELGHLGDLLLITSSLEQFILCSDFDKTLTDIVPKLYTVRYDDSKFDSVNLKYYSAEIQQDAETARNDPKKIWPKRTSGEVCWLKPGEFWNIMCIRLLEIGTDRFFCLNPYGDNITLLNKNQHLRDLYSNEINYPAIVNWTNPEDLKRYRAFLEKLRELKTALEV